MGYSRVRRVGGDVVTTVHPPREGALRRAEPIALTRALKSVANVADPRPGDHLEESIDVARSRGLAEYVSMQRECVAQDVGPRVAGDERHRHAVPSLAKALQQSDATELDARKMDVQERRRREALFDGGERVVERPDDAHRCAPAKAEHSQQRALHVCIIVDEQQIAHAMIVGEQVQGSSDDSCDHTAHDASPIHHPFRMMRATLTVSDDRRRRRRLSHGNYPQM